VPTSWLQRAHGSDLLIIKPDACDMVLASEAYAQKASVYEKMADEECASAARRKLFARKANSMRILARLNAKGAEPMLRAVKQTSVPESMQPPHKPSLWSKITQIVGALGSSKG
jgi:hypothetical protein